MPSETAGCGNVGNTINIIHEPRTRQEEFISKKIIFFKIFVFGIFFYITTKNITQSTTYSEILKIYKIEK